MPGYLLEATPAVAEAALEVPYSDQLRRIDKSDAGLFLDAQLWQLAHADARLSLRLGEALEPMLQRNGYRALSYANVKDYCREETGLSKATAERMVRLYRGLKAFPLVHEAYLAGTLSECQALLLLSYLPKLDDEAGWVEKARELTVRGLEQALKEARGGSEGEAVVQAPAANDTRHYRLSPPDLLDFQICREMAGRIAGAELKDWQVLEVLAAEFLAGPRPRPTDQPIPRPPQRETAQDRDQRLQDLWKMLEEEFGRWGYLSWEPVPVTLSADLERPFPEDPQLRQRAIDRLMLTRRRLHLYLGRILFTFHRMSLWRQAGFLSLAHYGQERLGLSSTTVNRLVNRERNFLHHPQAFEAVWEGRLSLSQAHALFPILWRVHDQHKPAWIEFAGSTTTSNVEATVKATCDLAETDPETFRLSEFKPPPVAERPSRIRWRARRDDEPWDIPALLGPLAVVIGTTATWIPTLRLRVRQRRKASLTIKVPEEIQSLLEDAEATAAASTASEALRLFMDSFILTWSKADRQMRAQARRLLEAADYRCQVPGCTERPELELHHLKFRSRGEGTRTAILL